MRPRAKLFSMACTASALTSTPGIVVRSQLLDQQTHLLVDLVDRAFNSDPLKQNRRARDHQLGKRLGALGERLPQLLDVGNAARRDQTELREVIRLRALTTSSPRVRNTIERAWASFVLTATKRIVGR